MKKNKKGAANEKFNLSEKLRTSLIVAFITVSVLLILGGKTLLPQSKAQETISAETVAAPAAQFCNPNLISITGSLGSGKATPYPSNINVSGVSGLITSVSVKLNTIQHTWGRDIDILLVGPGGQKFVIMSDVGQSQGFDNPATITISDAGAAQFTRFEQPIPTGTYKPTNHSDEFNPDAYAAPAPVGPYNEPGPAPAGNATFASVFNQADPNGIWSLYVMDDSSSNEGSIAGGWCLDIVTAAPAANNMQFAATNFNGNAGGTGTVTVNRVNPGAGAVSVNYATANGSATGGATCAAGVDYIPTSGILNFAAGETSKTFTVQLCPDTTLEPNETIKLALSNPTGGAFVGTPGAATLTIIPAGPPATQFCNPNTINIPISGSILPYPANVSVSGMPGVVRNVKVTLYNIQHSWASDIDILLVSPSGRKFVVMSDVGEDGGFDNATTITLTDAATNDLLNVSQQIVSGAYKPTNLDADDDNFPSPAPSAPYNQPAPAGSATFANVFNNTNPNGVWSLYVSDDSSAAGGTIGGWCLDIVSGTPVPDEIQFSSSNYNRSIDTMANVTVKRPNTSAGAVAVDYATSNGTATGGAACDAGVDYVSTSGTLNFADGETSKNISVQLCPDGTPEPPETVNLTLSNPTGGAVIGTPGAATITIYNGDLPCDVTWTRAASPHVISGIMTILADQIVCVEPGGVVQFASQGKINLYGQLRAVGTPTERIAFTGQNVFPNRIEVAGTMDVRFADVGIPLNMNANGSLTARDSNFGLHGAIISFPGITFNGTQRFVSLENVVFDSNDPVQSQNAELYASGLILLMKNVTFKNSAFFSVFGSQIKFENVVSQNSNYEGFSFSQGGMQPLLLENLSVTNCARAGLDLFSGNFLVGQNVTIQNCEYPVSGKGGLMPESILPPAGNRNNWIEVGQPGGSAIYANVGLPYVVEGFSNIGGIEFLPGVTVKARPNFSFYNEFSPLRVLGLPNAPVTFEPFDPAQKWDGGQFNFNGNRLDYVILDGMVSGVISSGGTGGNYYIDNSIIRNNDVGVIDRTDSNGAAYLQTNLFTNNQTAIVERDSRINTRQRTNPNLFENNATAVLSTGVADVRYNWWNSPTGPTTPTNPGGTGDVINGGARFTPFLTTRPDTTDRPPVVRMPRAPFAETGLLDAGKKILIHWDASDDRGIVKQKILFSRDSTSRSAFTTIADNLPPEQRSFEFTVPTVGFVQSGSEQFIRIVAVDEKGQEGFDDWMPLIPAGDPQGELIITSNVAGRVFRPGDQIPFTTQTTVGFNECSMTNYLIFDADRRIVSLGVNSIVTMPPISTDTARLMRICSRSLNQQRYFFSEPFAIRYDPRFPDAAPQVSLLAPTAGQRFAAGDVVPLTWTAADDEAIRYFNIQSSSDNGRTWIQIAENLPPTTTSYDWQPFVRGNLSDVRIRVIAVDRRFQNSSATHSIDFVAPQNAPPTVQVTFPADGASYTVGQSTFIAANAADPDGVIQRVEFYVKGSAFTPETDPAFIGSDTTAPYQVAWNYPFAQGYVVTARAFDQHNQMITSAPVSVTVNPFNPAPLPIGRPELTSPLEGGRFSPPANVTLQALPAPTHRTIVRVEFYNGTTLVGTDTTAPYSMTVNNLPAGKYTFFVKSVADNNAESVSQPVEINVKGKRR